MARNRGKREEISFLRGRNIMFANGQRTGETNCTTPFHRAEGLFQIERDPAGNGRSAKFLMDIFVNQPRVKYTRNLVTR